MPGTLAPRPTDLTLGALCRIGIALSSAFWLPTSLALGIAGATGRSVFTPADTGGGMTGFVTGLLHGIGCSIATDLMLLLGALALVVVRGIARAAASRPRA